MRTLVDWLIDMPERMSSMFEWLPPLFARLVVGWVFMWTGWAKLNNLPGVTQNFAEWGIPYPQIMTPFVSAVEFGGGLLLLLGLFTRLAATPLVIVMIVAILAAKLGQIPGIRVISVVPPALPGGGTFPVDVVVASTAPPDQVAQFADSLVMKAFASGMFMFADTDVKFDQPQTEVVFEVPDADGLCVVRVGERCRLVFGHAGDRARGDLVLSSFAGPGAGRNDVQQGNFEPCVGAVGSDGAAHHARAEDGDASDWFGHSREPLRTMKRCPETIAPSRWCAHPSKRLAHGSLRCEGSVRGVVACRSLARSCFRSRFVVGLSPIASKRLCQSAGWHS